MNCGIHLLANAEAVAENRDVPTTIDPDALRRKYGTYVRTGGHGLPHRDSSSSTDLLSSPPSSVTGREAADTVTEYKIAHDARDEVPTDSKSQSPSTYDVAGHASAETATAPASQVHIIPPTRMDDATSQASTPDIIPAASSSDGTIGLERPAVFASAIDLSTTLSNSALLNSPSDSSRSASWCATDQPDLQSVRETQRLHVEAGYAHWNDRFETAWRNLQYLQTQASELHQRCHTLGEQLLAAAARESVWQGNLEGLEGVRWKVLPEGGSRDKDPSLDDFRANIRQTAAAAREEDECLRQEIDECHTRQRALEESVERAKGLVKVHGEEKARWQSYIQHLDSFMISETHNLS